MTLNGSHFLILLKKNKTKQNKNPSKVKVIKHQEEWTYIFPRNDDNVFFLRLYNRSRRSPSSQLLWQKLLPVIMGMAIYVSKRPWRK